MWSRLASLAWVIMAFRMQRVIFLRVKRALGVDSLMSGRHRAPPGPLATRRVGIRNVGDWAQYLVFGSRG